MVGAQIPAGMEVNDQSWAADDPTVSTPPRGVPDLRRRPFDQQHLDISGMNYCID